MAWISVYQEVDGPKLRKLSKMLSTCKAEALGILNFLWFWGMVNADETGKVLEAERTDIEDALAGVTRIDPTKVVDSLFAAGWLDEADAHMWKHLEECYDDPHCLVIANPPTYAAGFEKWYDTGGRVTWKEPEYGIFDPATGLHDLYEKMNGAKCLLVCYEENAPGLTAGTPIFARYGVRDGVNVYLTSNRPDEATALANGKMVTRPNEGKLEPLDCSILPRDYEITRKSRIQVTQIERTAAQYYRKLWTHNFVGSSAPINLALLIDGKLAGVFGLDKSALTMGAFGTQVSDAVFLMYGMTVPHKTYRLGRLLTMLAQNKPLIMSICTDLEREKAKTLKTVQMTKYPEAKEMRGLMELTKKVPDKKMGFRLTYESPLKDRNAKQALNEWLGGEERWRRQREKTKSQQQ